MTGGLTSPAATWRLDLETYGRHSFTLMICRCPEGKCKRHFNSRKSIPRNTGFGGGMECTDGCWISRRRGSTSDGSFAGFVGSAADITDQKLAQEALEKIGGKLIEAQEEERSRIARELHDDICQRLALLSMELEQANRGSKVQVARRSSRKSETIVLKSLVMFRRCPTNSTPRSWSILVWRRYQEFLSRILSAARRERPVRRRERSPLFAPRYFPFSVSSRPRKHCRTP